MTEDDTFNRLKRPSRQQMYTMMLDWKIEFLGRPGGLHGYLEEQQKFLKLHSWSYDEYYGSLHD